jgi:aspartyl-tRNA(Asn)/glutamyl-tRNA(Gln) amidotransferase subunit A
MPARERAICSPDVLAAYDAALQELERLGAEVVDVDLPHVLTDFVAHTSGIISAEGYALMRELIDDPDVPLDEHVRPRLAAGRSITSQAYLESLSRREAMKLEFAAALADVDALLTPTTAMPAVPVDEVDQTDSPAHFTRFVNFLDLCALAVPNGFSDSGLPCSLQIVCRGYDEAMALRIGWAYENATQWHLRTPPEPR